TQGVDFRSLAVGFPIDSESIYGRRAARKSALEDNLESREGGVGSPAVREMTIRACDGFRSIGLELVGSRIDHRERSLDLSAPVSSSMWNAATVSPPARSAWQIA